CYSLISCCIFTVFFCSHPASPAVYPLSLHDALPICGRVHAELACLVDQPDQILLRQIEQVVEALDDVIHRLEDVDPVGRATPRSDRKSTRLNSSHVSISYAVFCLKKKKQNTTTLITK